ncbi:hypothetical protein SAMN06296036_105151 [Pseudobacteriovorax antillogorgiicola]|uniref:Lipoprotein n=1 Tax=Pseudobacteriovorax antillogorgiicola TaxID=1513793 RepID=A0A1Y6BN76_9BACT|nr:hypothetical protein EDD56_105173 [Pseudobacteriovorax antillogorgiicola]SMF12316.1 hypothetical protein SAMN06296036_105151 [Pseudobacteriovorax antillogorgiicola]
MTRGFNHALALIAVHSHLMTACSSGGQFLVHDEQTADHNPTSVESSQDASSGPIR